MSSRTKIVFLAICMLFILSAGVVVANYDHIQQYFVQDEAAMNEKIKALSHEQLINEIEGLAAKVEGTNDLNALIPFVSELYQRRDTLQDQDILNVIKDETKARTTREAMVDIYNMKYESMPIQGSLKALLEDPAMDKAIKTRIVSVATFSEDDLGILKQLISEDDGLLAFHSLRAISNVNAKAAYELADNILQDIDSASDDKLSAALRATAKYLRGHRTASKAHTDLEQDFLNLSLRLIQNSDELYIKDSAFFALSEVGSKEIISTILRSDFIDRELKVFAVDQNFMVLKDMLLNDPAVADIEAVVTAMELLPIRDLIDPLTEAMKHIKDDDLIKRSEAAIKAMKENGIDGNHKWLDKN